MKDNRAPDRSANRFVTSHAMQFYLCHCSWITEQRIQSTDVRAENLDPSRAAFEHRQPTWRVHNQRWYVFKWCQKNL